MNEFLLAPLIGSAQIWYAIPLVVVISLVYGATRHETVPGILNQAIRSAIWVSVFMGIIFVVVWLAGFGVAS